MKTKIIEKLLFVNILVSFLATVPLLERLSGTTEEPQEEFASDINCSIKEEDQELVVNLLVSTTNNLDRVKILKRFSVCK